MRKTLRQLSPGSELHAQIVISMDKVKAYVKANQNANDDTKQKQNKIKLDEIKQKQRSTTFMVDHIQRDLRELNQEFSKQSDEATDEEITKWKQNLPRLSTKLDKVADNINSILKSRFLDEKWYINLEIIAYDN